MARVSWIAGRLRVLLRRGRLPAVGFDPTARARSPAKRATTGPRGSRRMARFPAQAQVAAWARGEVAQLRFWAKIGCGPNEQYKKRFFFYFQKPFEYEFFDEFH